MSSRKLSLKVKNNEAVVVADVEWIKYTSEVLKYLSTQPDWRNDSQFLAQMAENMEFWLGQTKLDDEYDS